MLNRSGELRLELLEQRVLLTMVEEFSLIDTDDALHDSPLLQWREDEVLAALVSVEAGGDQVVTLGDPVNVGSMFDSGIDVNKTYTATIDWDDGTVEAGLVTVDPGAQSPLTVRIDYSLDTNNFFDTQEKKDLLQLAADTIIVRFGDTLDAIVPGGGSTWKAVFTHPGTGQAGFEVPNLTVAENEIVIFAGGRSINSLGIGGPGGFSAVGFQPWFNTLDARGEAGDLANPETDHGPWGGVVTFDSDNPNWYFGADENGIGGNQNDFFSVALHEVGHLLGFGTADSWEALVVGTNYTGAASVAQFGGTVPVQLNGHWAEGTFDGADETAMDPTLLVGTRKTMTELDFAGFDDLGWELINATPTGTIDGSHTYTQANTYTVTVTVFEDGIQQSFDTLEVTADAPVVNITTPTANAAEEGPVSGEFGFTRTGLAASPLTVNFTVSGTATEGADYTTIGTSITFPTGVTQVTLEIDPVDDDDTEAAETVVIDLDASVDYDLGGSVNGTVTIAASDLPEGAIGDLIFNDANGNEIFDVKTEVGIGNVTVDLYNDVNGDGLLDGGDTFLSQVTTDANGIYDFTALVSGDYLVDVSDDNDELDTFFSSGEDDPLAVTLANDEDFNEADFGYFDPTDLKFGIVPGEAKAVKLTFRQVVYSLSGLGMGQLVFDGEDEMSLEFDGTTAKSKAKAKPLVKGEMTEVYDVSVLNGSIGSVDMRGTTIKGDYNSQGSTGKLLVYDIADNHLMNIGPGGPKATLTLMAHDIFDTTLTSQIPIKKMTFNTWEDTDGDKDSITAPWAGTVQSANNFQADMTLTDAAVKATLKKLSVARLISDAVIRTAGPMGAVAAGALENVTLFAGVNGALDTLPAVAGDFVNPLASIKSVKLSGIAGIDDSFVNSLIGGFTIKSVALGRVAIDNGDVEFGVAANNIKSVAYQVGDTSFKISKMVVPIPPVVSDDFTVRVI